MLVTKRYFIRRGDSEALIAVRFGCTREDLLNANPGPHVVTDRYGSRGFYPGWFVPGRRINVPIVASSGAVSGPSGQVGCGGGCAGGYGMQQFGYGPSAGRRGAVGFQIPRLRDDYYRLPMPVVFPKWDDTHPNWQGSFLSFWSTKLHATLKNLTKANSAYDVAGLARRVSEQPNIEIKLNAWLRSNWDGPVQFIDSNWSTTPTGPNQFDVAMRGWMDPDVTRVAKRAAAKYLNDLCMGAAGHPYDPYTGECSLSAGWNAEQVNDEQITPETYVKRRAPATGYGPFTGRRG